MRGRAIATHPYYLISYLLTYYLLTHAGIGYRLRAPDDGPGPG
jgi:hypothetical protein